MRWSTICLMLPILFCIPDNDCSSLKPTSSVTARARPLGRRDPTPRPPAASRGLPRPHAEAAGCRLTRCRDAIDHRFRNGRNRALRSQMQNKQLLVKFTFIACH